MIATFCSLNALYRFVGVARSLKKGDWGTDVLAVLAIASTLLTQEYLASLVVVIMTWTGEFIEYYAANKAKSELKLLKKLKPTIAHLKVEENLIDSPLENIKIGDIILIKSGEIIPTEGTIVEGVAVFDESSITGEVAPIRKAKGDKVLSGTKNGSTSFYMRVETDPKNSEYQKIIDLVANSLENKPKIVTLASQYSIFFSALSVIIALVAYLITNDVRTIAEVLVLATPCPLLIAAPVAFLGGINAGAKRGIIFKNSASLQTLSNMKTVAFDKTGTLTVGFPVLEDVEIFDNKYSKNQILNFAKALEKYSSHPLAKAFENLDIKEEANDVEISGVKEVAGAGIEGIINGQKISIKKSQSGRGENGINSAFFINEKPIATFQFADKVKADSIKTIRNLKRFHIRKVAMLTGDGEEVAKKTAKEVGVDSVYAALKPEEKVNIVKGLEPKPVLFVGDGINDAPVLASADLGLAISHGNLSAAAETADIVIGGDHLCDIDYCFSISKKALKIAKQSMIGGIALSVIAMLFAASGFIPAIYGAIGQELIDIFAIANGLRASFVPRKISKTGC